MPWQKSTVMDERLRFVARLREGERMSDVCRSFGISRKTGYKIWNRYKEEGEALCDRSRRPVYLTSIIVVSFRNAQGTSAGAGKCGIDRCSCGFEMSRFVPGKAQ